MSVGDAIFFRRLCMDQMGKYRTECHRCEQESEFIKELQSELREGFSHPMTFIHQALCYGKLVPSSHQRGKPNHIILCTFSGGNNWLWKCIPISNGLREEWALVNVSSCSGGLKSQWMMISTAPNSGYKVIYLHIYLYILEHPLARIMCSCARQRKQSVIEETVLDFRRS